MKFNFDKNKIRKRWIEENKKSILDCVCVHRYVHKSIKIVVNRIWTLHHLLDLCNDRAYDLVL